MKNVTLLILFSFFCFTLPAQENLALNKTATASSTLGGNSAANANDGKSNSRWESAHGINNQWIQIDLGDVYDLTGSKIDWEGASAATYEVEVSGNESDWRTIAQRSETGGERIDELDFTESAGAKEVRYIRLNLLTRTTTYGYSIHEWEVYGTLSVVTPVASSVKLKPENVMLLTDMPDELNILSLNNSLIDYNDQPAVFNQLATSAGKTANWVKQTRLGQSLRYHYEEGDGMIGDGLSAKMAIRSKAWTHIILQEQSSKPMDNFTDFMASVKLWVDYVRNYCPNPDARIVLMLNWPYITSTDFEADHAKLCANYKAVAEELGVMICPVSSAFDLVRTTDGDHADLYTDNRHPSALASYLSACTFYATFFNASPVGLTYTGSLTQENAARMQNRAWSAYNDYENVVNDGKGTVRYSAAVWDQFNRPMTGMSPLEWSVNGGGTIVDGVFTSNGEKGSYTVTVGNNTFSETANVMVKAPETRNEPEDYFIEIENGSNYSQNFDAIGTEATATLPIGWKADKNTSTPRTLGYYELAVTTTEQRGGNNIASNATNGIYNFGAGDAATATDRAIGGISTSISGGTRCVNIYLKMRNTGNTDIKSFNIAYDVEKYRKGTNSAGFAMQMYYSTDGQTWTSAGDNFKTVFTADAATEGYADAPGETRAVSANLSQKLAAGGDLYLAWNYSVIMGTEAQAAQALGLDNVVIETSDLEIIDFDEIAIDKSYMQDFDAIGTEAVATLPLGWKIEKRLDAPRKVGTFSAALNQTEQVGGNSIASNAKNGIYNFGAGNAATATDRAIGGISTGIADGTRCVNMYLKVRNTQIAHSILLLNCL